MDDAGPNERHVPERNPPTEDDKTVALYYRKFRLWERTGAGFNELKLMRKQWLERTGEDTLHRKAFGEP